MKGKTILLLAYIFISCLVKAQTVIVNADGTHSILIDNGATKTIVNPDGKHSTVIDNGSTKTIVNPNGTHTTVIDHGFIKTVINPDGTHSLIIYNRNTKKHFKEISPAVLCLLFSLQFCFY